MTAKGANGVGRFSVEIEVANYGDLTLMHRGLLPPDQVRRETIQSVVDSGATKLVLPHAVVKRLGLPLGDKINVRYADGRKAQRDGAEGSSATPGPPWHLYRHRRAETEVRPARRDRPRGPRSARGLHDAAGRSPRSPRRDL